MQVIRKYHKEKEEGTRNEENHMDRNITCMLNIRGMVA